MKKIKVTLLSILTVIFCANISFVNAEIPEIINNGDLVLNNEYSGTLPKNAYGNTIPIRYNFKIEKNSIIRIFLYRQSTDTFLYLNSDDNPYTVEKGYNAEFGGSVLTELYDGKIDKEASAYSTSRYGATAWNHRPENASYVETFGNIAKGNYYIAVAGGGNYRFKIVVEPLKYNDDIEPNDTQEQATVYMLNNEQEGNMILNGPTNVNFKNDCYDYYKVKIDNPGKYNIDFSTDGFFQGQVSILGDTNGYTNGFNPVIFYVETQNPNMKQFSMCTYEEHVNSANTVSQSFDITKPGDYIIGISRRTHSAGSYKFKITGNTNTTSTTTTTTNTTNTTDNNNVVDNNTDDGKIDEADAKLQSLTITPQSPVVKVGKTLALKAKAQYSNGDNEDVTDFIKWVSSNNKIATVDENGVVKGIAKGDATIMATIEEQTFKINIKVQGDAIKKIVSLRPVVYLKVGDQGKNNITAYYESGTKKDITGLVTLKSKNNNILIYKNTTIKAMKKGTAVVNVSYNGLNTTFKVIVK